MIGLAWAGLGLTVLAGVAMHLSGTVDPVHHMISDVVAEPAGAMLLALACAGLVAVAGALATVAARHGPRRRLVPALLGVWAAALVTITVFPTNMPGTELTQSAVIHRYGAALTAVVPPVVGLLVARTRQLRNAAWTTAGAAALFAAAHGPAVLLGADVVPYAGLAERLLFALILVLLVLIGRDLRPVVAVSGSPRGERPVTVGPRPVASMVPDAPPTIAEVA